MLLLEQVYEAGWLLQKFELSCFNCSHFKVLAASSGAISIFERLSIDEALSADFFTGCESLTILFAEQKLAKSILSHFIVNLSLRLK